MRPERFQRGTVWRNRRPGEEAARITKTISTIRDDEARLKSQTWHN